MAVTSRNLENFWKCKVEKLWTKWDSSSRYRYNFVL